MPVQKFIRYASFTSSSGLVLLICLRSLIRFFICLSKLIKETPHDGDAFANSFKVRHKLTMAPIWKLEEEFFSNFNKIFPTT